MEFEDHGHEVLWVKGCGAAEGCHTLTAPDLTGEAREDAEDDLADALRDKAEARMALIWDDVDEDGVLDSTGDTGLLVDLKAKLMQIVLLKESNSAYSDDAVMWPLDIAGALWNFNMVREDRSVGLHNFNYATKLLESSIAAVDAYILTLP